METKTIGNTSKFIRKQVQATGMKHDDDDGDVFNESLDDLQIQVNNLHSEDGEEKLMAIQFFAEYIENGEFVPPELFIQFRDNILTLLSNIASLPPLQASNVLRIIGDIVEFFEDDFDYASLFQNIWAFIPNDDAINACGMILKQSQTLAEQILENEEVVGTIISFLQNENSDLRNSGLFLICSLTEDKENHIMMRNFFDITCNLLENDDETDDNISSAISVLKLFANSENGITFISDRPDLGNLLHKVLHRPKCDSQILDFLLRIGETSSNCLKIFLKLELIDFIISNVNNQTNDKMEKNATKILYCIAQDGQEGVQFLFEQGILQSLIEKSSRNQSVWKLCLSTLCTCCYKGSSEIINAIVGVGFIDFIDQNLDSSSDNVVNDLLLALQAIIASAELQGNKPLLEELAANDDLVDKIYSLTEDHEGDDNGRIANLIYQKLTED